MSVFAGGKLLLGAIVKESSIDGSGTLTELVVSMEGNFSQVVSYSNGEWQVSQSALPEPITQLQGQRFLEPRIFKDPIHRGYRP